MNSNMLSVPLNISFVEMTGLWIVWKIKKQISHTLHNPFEKLKKQLSNIPTKLFFKLKNKSKTTLKKSYSLRLYLKTKKNLIRPLFNEFDTLYFFCYNGVPNKPESVAELIGIRNIITMDQMTHPLDKGNILKDINDNKDNKEIFQIKYYHTSLDSFLCFGMC